MRNMFSSTLSVMFLSQSQSSALSSTLCPRPPSIHVTQSCLILLLLTQSQRAIPLSLTITQVWRSPDVSPPSSHNSNNVTMNAPVPK